MVNSLKNTRKEREEQPDSQPEWNSTLQSLHINPDCVSVYPKGAGWGRESPQSEAEATGLAPASCPLFIKEWKNSNLNQ